MPGRPICDNFWLSCSLDPDAPLPEGEFIRHTATVTTDTPASRYEPLAEITVSWSNGSLRTIGRQSSTHLTPAENQWISSWGRGASALRTLRHVSVLYRGRTQELDGTAADVVAQVSVNGCEPAQEKVTVHFG